MPPLTDLNIPTHPRHAGCAARNGRQRPVGRRRRQCDQPHVRQLQHAAADAGRLLLVVRDPYRGGTAVAYHALHAARVWGGKCGGWVTLPVCSVHLAWVGDA
eukprot:363324-Chlamydomonas_euryale.AAC.29